MRKVICFLLYCSFIGGAYANYTVSCPNPPPTPEANIIWGRVGLLCAFYPASQSVLIVTYPLGDEYKYSIDGIYYQSSPSFLGVWNNQPFPITVTVKDENGCVSEPLVKESTDAEHSYVPMVNVTQPDCSDIPENGQLGTISVTFPLNNSFWYSIDGENYQQSPVFFNVPSGSYGVTYRFSMPNPENCTSDPLEVVVNSVELPTPEAVLIPIICSFIPEDLGTIVVTYPLGDEYEYSIDGVNYQSSPVFPNAWVFDTFQLTVRQGSCISDSLEFSNIEQSTVPIADVAQPDCSDVPETGQLGTITVTFPLGDMFQYSIDGVNYQNSPVFFNVTPDTYALTFRYNESENCVSDPFEVSIFTLDIPDIPTVIITQPTCDNPFGSIEVTSPFMDYPPYTYSINGEDYQFSPFFENLSPGIYQLTAQLLAGGCPSGPLEVNIHFPPAIPETPTVNVIQPTCANPYGSIEVTSPVDEGHELFPNYEYSINGVDYYEFTLFDNLSSGVYYVTVRHLMSGCISESVEVIINELSEISVNIVAVCENENRFVLKAGTQEQNYQYLWSTGETTSVIEVNTTGIYSVIVSLESCSKEFSVSIDAIPCMIPKGISPNGDFLNDEFDLSGFGMIDRLGVFNRYGKTVYTQSNYTNQWKGQANNGKELPSGTYYYKIVFQNGETKSGWVYLNR